MILHRLIAYTFFFLVHRAKDSGYIGRYMTYIRYSLDKRLQTVNSFGEVTEQPAAETEDYKRTVPRGVDREASVKAKQ